MTKSYCQFGRRLSACVFLATCALGQTNAPSAKSEGFPLSERTAPLDQAAMDEAIATARATDVNTTVPAALLYQGLALFQEEKYKECIPFLEESLRLDPSLTAGWEGLGWAYIRTENEERAWRLWDYFRELMPDAWQPYNLLAQTAIMKHDWETADRHFRKALQLKPDHFDLRFWYAQNLLRLGQPIEAERLFRELIKEEPDRLDIQINLANLLTHRLEYDESVSIWRHVNAELPGNPNFLMDQAVLEVRVGELKAADQLCLDTMAIETNNMRAMTLRADIAEIGDMTELSVERLEKLIDATEDPILRSRARLRLANRCTVLNKRKPGLYATSYILGQIHEAINENPADVGAHVLYAERLLVAKRYEECKPWAIDVLEKHNRHNIRAKAILFELALVEHRYDDAEQVLHDRFSNYDSTDPMRYFYEARLNMMRGAYNEALQCVDRMEAAAEQGCVFTLLYHDLTESDWMPITSVRRLYEHLNALRQEGFTFISPADIPSVIGLKPGVNRQDPEPEDPSVPWTALLVDNIRYGITGERKFKFGKKKKEYARPMKVVAVTFDDALRSAFTLGASVAEEIGVPFGMFAITKTPKDYQPSVAGWNEMAEYVANGTWVIGSHLYGAHDECAVDKELKDLRWNLPNRIWLPEKDRLESMNEWDKRMRNEFRLSRKIMREKLGEQDSKVAMVAYPYGDIGQETACNLSLLRNPSQSIVSEAGRNYQVGFLQGQSGYTTSGDDLLMTRRYEPNWFDEGADVVNQAYEYHPLFMARRTRVEIAFLMNMPHLAEEMLNLLKRDGYPEDLCRKITIEVRAQFRNRPNRDVRPLVASSSVAVDSTAGGGQNAPTHNMQTLQADKSVPSPVDPTAREAVQGEKSDVTDFERVGTYQEGTVDPWVYISHPFVGGEISHSKANDQFEILRYGGRAGLNLNKNLQLSGEYFETHIDQDLIPRWNAVFFANDDLTSYLFKALKREARGRLSYRTGSGAVLSGSLGMAEMDFDYNDEDVGYLFEDDVGSGEFEMSDDDPSIIGDLSANWSPRDNLNMYVFYARDLVTSAVKKIESDSVGIVGRWKPSDTWHMTLRSQYWSYEDDNAMFYIQSESFWEMIGDMGIWLGTDLSTISSSDPSDYYWTPYWDQRLMGVLRYLQAWQGYMFRVDFLGGLQREEGRPLRREEDAGLGGGADWELAWGVSSTYNKRLFKYCDLFVDGSVMALRDYIDHRFLIGFNLGF